MNVKAKSKLEQSARGRPMKHSVKNMGHVALADTKVQLFSLPIF